MRRFARHSAALVIAAILVSGVPARAAETVERLGIGAAYDDVGRVAVMHEGRVKPLDTVAREEVSQVYGNETVTLGDPRKEVAQILGTDVARTSGDIPSKAAKWRAVGAFLGWTVRPEFWDDQPFILVDYLPLRRAVLARTIESRLKAIADKPSTPEPEKDRLRSMAVDSELTASMAAAFVRGSNLPPEDRYTIAELASKLTKGHRWLSPRELQESTITTRNEEAALPFLHWAAAANDEKERFDDNPLSSKRPTELERRGIEVARRLMTYMAYSGDRLARAGVLLIVPRPSDATYLSYTAQAIKDIRAKGSVDGLSPMQFDALAAIDGYWKLVPREDRKPPGQDVKADQKFTAWLRDSSTWVPLKTFLKSKPEDLIAAGYPEGSVRAFQAAYHGLEQAEVAAPGHVAETTASRFMTASRALGEAVSSQYPSTAIIDRETRFNAVNPFGLAPYAYGTAMVLLVLSLTCFQTTSESSPIRRAGRGAYRLAVVAMVGGIGLEIYGFYSRIRISGWAPVTNMYESVIWVALVAAALALVFELIFRQVTMALAGSAVALLCTVTAASVSLLDPGIKSLEPVLRDNFWLGTHVLAEVSSYAAFGLAWALGLIATLQYLTATYRRSPRIGELMLTMIPGLLLLTGGGAGVAASYGAFGPAWTTSDRLFYVFAVIALAGETLTLMTTLALGGEMINRLTLRAPSRRIAAQVKPLATYIYRTMQVGVLLIAVGTILGGVWADYSWGRFWGWDAKEVWALTTLIVYLIPLHGRYAGWVNSFWLVFASVVCYLSVIMAWYGVNFVLGVGLHSYGFVEGGSQGAMSVIIAGVLALPVAAAWRRTLGYRPDAR
jgi:ABC-type transport system involved in cytochrome c biogenesis permease subunit